MGRGPQWMTGEGVAKGHQALAAPPAPRAAFHARAGAVLVTVGWLTGSTLEVRGRPATFWSAVREPRIF